MQWLKALQTRGVRVHWYPLAVGLLLAASITATLIAVHNVQADPAIPQVSASASCATLAGVDRTATNGANWGQTMLPGFGQPGGWFGVPVCANGLTAVSGDNSSVSCDRVPSNWNRTGCAPGQPTSDGYGWTFQCPELVVRFSAWAFGDNPGDWGQSGWGNAPDLWLPVNHPSDFVMYPNGSSVAPVPGDILVWGSLNSQGQPWPAGPDGEHGGHIAVVVSATNGMVVTAEQNVVWGNQDHPSDQLALTKVGTRWILSGSTAHATQLPTYRWQSTMGLSRGTYGWLHSVRNTGHFPSSSRAVTVSSKHRSTTVPQQPSGGFPSLEAATVITGNGQLADLVWSNSDFFYASSATADVPHASVRSLGSPAGTLLYGGQRPATISLADGSRLSYGVGLDGNLYVARVLPTTFGVLWSNLGHPSSALLAQSSVSAAVYAGGSGVMALGSDGNLWWRSGPPSQLGSWQSIGKPSGTRLTGSFVLAGAPGQGTPLLLALTGDGRLFERVWLEAQFAADGSVQVPATWSSWIQLSRQPSGVTFVGTLFAAAETPETQDYIGAWPDTPLDILVLDQEGRLWWLRLSTQQAGWQISQVATPAPLDSLLGLAMVNGPPTASSAKPGAQLLQVYTASTSRSYRLTLPIPAGNGTLAAAGVWTSLSPLPSDVSPEVSGAALALGQNTSVLVLAVGDEVFIGGSPDSTSILLPAALQSGGVSPATSPKTWMAVGSSTTEPAFTDMLTERALDPRWEEAGAGAQFAAGRSGVSLLPTTGNRAALLQSAASGDFALSVYVVLPASGSGRAGLVLFSDDSDWLTLLADSHNKVSLCVEAWQETLPCATLSLSRGAGGIWLQVSRQGSTLTGAASLDGVLWRPVGSWTPSSTGAMVATWNMKTTTPTPSSTGVTLTPSATGAPAGTPLPSLVFTSWGIMAEGSWSAHAAATFNDFTF